MLVELQTPDGHDPGLSQDVIPLMSPGARGMAIVQTWCETKEHHRSKQQASVSIGRLLA